jgi:glycosyltransferase involved in cell wall biosynthesis
MPLVHEFRPQGPGPKVSIVLPTYNRARFLPQAFDSIRSQTMGDWELIVVDDGSTDGSEELIRTLAGTVSQPVCYVAQENRGAYAARNRGLDLARGGAVAFFDSDDVWLPHHLANCVEAMDSDSAVDWVYGATRRVEYETGRVLTPHSFLEDGRRRPFLSLTVKPRPAGRARVIDDRGAVACAIEHGLYCGLQNSVVSRRVFQALRFQTRFRNESEDQVFVIRALAAGFRFAYIEDIHLLYSVHSANSSASARDLEERKLVALLRELIEGYEDLGATAALSPAERRALNRRLSRAYYWCLGYSVLLSHGRAPEALRAMRRGMALWPWDPRLWKTYAVTVLRHAAARRAAPGRSPGAPPRGGAGVAPVQSTTG